MGRDCSLAMRTVMDSDSSIHSTFPQRLTRKAYVATSWTPTWPPLAELKAYTRGRQSAIFMEIFSSLTLVLANVKVFCCR